MKNPYYNQNTATREFAEKQFPNGLDTTMELLLAFNFSMSHLQPEVTPISESVYDKGIDGIKELNDHMADKYGKDDNTKLYAEASNLFFWLVLRLPAKEEYNGIPSQAIDRKASKVINLTPPCKVGNTDELLSVGEK